ncbi:hypothetical protein IIA15_00210 [candidate division TA06 bacterium]|nr:hypothetical protein [candidate division TA06 bacterium]
MKAGILKKSKNLIELYLHHCGVTEVPQTYYLWTAISLIAACVSDRVHYEKFKGSKLTPNLYTFLLGKSGLGKGQAIGTTMKFVQSIPKINGYRGKASPPYLIDYMGKSRKDEEGETLVKNPKLYLITPELSMAVEKVQADALIKLMCELYDGGDYLFQEGTRKGGPVSFRGHCINWIVGTVLEWLVQVVPQEAIQGGFFARSIAINADYDFSKRIVRPYFPPDYDDVVDHLMVRLESLTRLEGEFHLSSEASRIESDWYEKRPNPIEDWLMPSWKRDHDMTLKIAMVLSLASSEKLIIEGTHMVRAQRLTKDARKAMGDLVVYAATTPETDGLLFVKATVKRFERIPHAQLLRLASNRGIIGERMKTFIDSLRQQGFVGIAKGPRGGLIYVWVKKGNIRSAAD